MSFLIQTILIGILALIVAIFSPATAGWVVWGAYLLVSVGFFFKARDYRRRLLRGEESDLTGATILPPIAITAVITLVIFLFIDLSKLHLLWILPLMALVYELLISRKMWKSFGSEIQRKKEED